LGKQLRSARSDAKWITVVGVTGDLKTYGLDEQTVPEMFLPYRQTWTPTMSFVIRTARDPAALGRDAARAIHELDRTQPVFDVRTLREHLAQSVSGPRFNTLLISIFAVVALLIAAIGLYGVISYSVQQRTREIGIRMALGAESSRILRSVLFDGLRISLIGLAAGAVASFWLTRLIKGMLFEVRPADPWVFGVVASIAIAVAAMAALIPARTASNTDPVVALRWE
jgi:putative ABC transport system permease protein